MQRHSSDEAARPVGHGEVVAIALPIMLSNATTPLIGFADTAVVGQLGEAHLIGAVAIGANIFNFLYWSFGFLRMGTTAFTAQALGARNPSEIAANLYRALIIATGAGVAMIAGQMLIAYAAFQAMGAPEPVERVARIYFEIRVWAAPAGLVNFALLGWFIGLGRALTAFYVQLFLNVLNIVLAVVLVIGFDLGVHGVAIAALVAEWAAAALGLVIARADLVGRSATVPRTQVLDLQRMKRTFQVNGDIMIRTLCVLTAFLFFTAQGARAGELTLAANALLMSITMVGVYLLDGFAFAAESLVGRAIGARAPKQFHDTVRVSTVWAGWVGLLLALGIWVCGPAIIDFMTTGADVRAEARAYLVWAALMPILGVWCFQLDGIFIGATRTADMRNMMIASLAVFFAAWAWLTPAYGNHGLWAALLVFNVARALTLLARYPALVRSSFA